MFHLAITRRHLLQSGAFAAIAPSLGIAAGVAAAGPASAQSGTGEPVWRHALSLFGDVKYPVDFKRFDYVNPDATKGGVARQILIGTFDNFNLAVAGVKGSLASAVALIYESLMTPSLDEVSTEYGALAESVSHPEDFSSVIYRLRAQAKWHDGKPVTPEDVIFSLEAFKKYHPQYSAYYRHVVKAEKAGERDIKFTFDAPGNRELPQIVGQLTVLPKHWWEGTDAQGRKRDVSATTLEMPLGSGPYRIKEFVAGRSIALERVKDYWGRDLAANVGRNNFDEMHKQIFYGQYKRVSSYFDGIDELMATGLPQGKELEILDTVRAEVPPEVFTTAYTNPVGGSPEAVRDNLREALRLFKEAGYEEREFWSSKTADIAGSRNITGIKNPAIDKLIERVIYATDRDDLVAATKALDRVLLWNHYVVPQWTYSKVRTARWDRFGRPAE